MKRLSLRKLSILLALIPFVLAVGPVYGGDGLNLKKGNVIRIIRVDVDPKMEEEFNRWYNSEHEHLLLKVPGVIWTYRGINLDGKGPKYFFLYAHENICVQKSDQYKAASRTEWAKSIRPFLKNFQAMNCEVIVPGPIPTHLRESNIIRTVQVDVKPEKDEDFNNWYDKEHIPLLEKVPGVNVIWRATNLGSKGQKYLTVYFQENMDVQKGVDYKKASQTNWLKSLLPYLTNLSTANYQVQF